MDERELTEIISRFIILVATRLPDDVITALKAAGKSAEEPMERRLFATMMENLEHARKERIPICQDTGIPYFHIKLGLSSPAVNYLEKCVKKAVVKATKELPLRPNAVDPLTEVNTETNVGRNVPWIDYELVPGSEDVEICLHLAGGGSSLVGRSVVLKPLEKIEGLINNLLEVLTEYGVNACPPLFLGIGIGATMEMAAVLSKRALLKTVGKRSENPKIAKLEETILQSLNELKIGTQGMGLGKSILDVHVDYSARHPTTFAVGISASCWVFRRGVLMLRRDGSFEVPTHREVDLL